MANPSTQQRIDFVTLGMFILDDIHPSPTFPSKTPSLSIPGGAGTYSLLGARLLSPSPSNPTVAMIIDAGTDFPSSLLSTIRTWSTSSLIRQRDALTTRGWNGYSGNEVRAFKYLTPKLRLTAGDLTAELLASKSFHLICSPERCITEVNSILSRRANERVDERPLFIWEPVPDLCTAEELSRTLEANKVVDVVSPNHDELAAMFGTEHGSSVRVEMVEEHASNMVEHGIGRDGEGAIVVRCGAVGCFVLSRRVEKWLPAYHTDSSKVVDPTGGGNGFLGGLAVGLVRTGDVVEASRWGSVSASLCIEQVGVPVLENTRSGEGERWNGVDVLARLAEFRTRTS
ncbi:unnamed protein product [Zymoseptoria tritici ST99CH_1A5]|uniref:Carbohydrate kinase PfkB domain-containing protein n=1 Tax=Zymoseptoria tritici ST99CH_1A5 TaxID=1276529 RepID=A0A1Y6LXC7_ZYMTR|nr:unnamed protein product [Zymoseptoria tritici ST99CH_1A5]